MTSASFVVKVGLLLAWICAFVLITFSFYATTHILPSSSSIKVHIKNLNGSKCPTVTIFAAARAFSGSIGSRQVFVIRSCSKGKKGFATELVTDQRALQSAARRFRRGNTPSTVSAKSLSTMKYR
ncbi:hypothetical protein L6452_30785 [Arctium lappa]|uniref:Uncharacterized protein n=1 Tax=Arctium lappa TaxID=4217 RepID=A0ACB8ZK44_ARCLA|nr:hypothetical protein L6452_30785 [Arctium lappa]